MHLLFAGKGVVLARSPKGDGAISKNDRKILPVNYNRCTLLSLCLYGSWEPKIMKKLLVLLGCAVLLFSGCQEFSRNKNAVEVIIEGGGEFPQFLAGTWKADDYAWQFVFEPNGTISSAVIGMGEVEIIPGRTATFPTISGGKAVFKPGLWTVHYDPQLRELTVEIVMDYIHFEMGPNLLEGKAKDLFIGKVSQDGKIWQADWFGFPDYMAYTSQTKRLTVTPEESFAGTLTFKKLQE